MRVYNSLTRKKEKFVPIVENQVKMYVCGQTVYDYCHLGHARKSVVFDMIRRWFIACGYKVTYVENITDIDDKIINRANENQENFKDLTKRFINYMHEDFAKLGVLQPDFEPRATEYILEMLEIIKTLIDKDYAYQAKNGDVYYRVRKFKQYGKLSGKSIEDLRSGERVEVEEEKEEPLDFVLWKAAKPGEPFWDSPFGKGRPGWHIECSAMSSQLLGKNFDIHGGGQDLQFPHHENEIAQSEAANECIFANYWMHNGFLNINDEKMSKSLGNFFTLRDVLTKYKPEVIRFFLLKTHYRSPLNFSQGGVIDARNGLMRIYQAVKAYSIDKTIKIDWNDEFALRFKAAMDDDFNTPLAISILFELVTQINKVPSTYLANLLVALGSTIGIISSNSVDFLQEGSSQEEVELIEDLIQKRNFARENKDFAKSDEIRAKLFELGVLLEDAKGKTVWKRIT